MARRKILFVIVEGPSDQAALGLILSRIYDKDSVHVHVMHCDITTKGSVSAAQIVSKVRNEIRHFAVSNHYTADDFKEVLHIVDMDGAYIPDENIIQDAAAKSPIYSPTQIRTRNKKGIESRNKQKRENLDILCGCSTIWNIPYRVYYMSSNLDHVLYNKLNSSNTDKENDAYRFARRYKNDLSGFVRFLSDSDFSVTAGYEESWEFIAQELHSLERHTNFALCLRYSENPVDK